MPRCGLSEPPPDSTTARIDQMHAPAGAVRSLCRSPCRSRPPSSSPTGPSWISNLAGRRHLPGPPVPATSDKIAGGALAFSSADARHSNCCVIAVSDACKDHGQRSAAKRTNDGPLETRASDLFGYVASGRKQLSRDQRLEYKLCSRERDSSRGTRYESSDHARTRSHARHGEPSCV